MTFRPSDRVPSTRRLASLAALGCSLLTALHLSASDAAAQAKPKPGALPGTSTIGPDRSTPPGSTRRAAPPPPPKPTDSTRTVTLSGTVFDSIAGAPLAGATVQLADERDHSVTLTATTDSAGNYRLPGVRPSRYLAGFFHSALDAIGLEMPPLRVDVPAASEPRLDFAIPSAATVLPAVCGENASVGRAVPANRDLTDQLAPTPKPGALIGAIRDAESGDALAGARVVITWNEVQVGLDGVHTAHRRVPVRARPDGGYVACGLPAATALVVSADAPHRHSGLVEIQLRAGQLARRDFALGDSTNAILVTLPDTTAAQEGRLAVPITVARGTARVSGVVRTPDGRPMGSAKLLVVGTGVTGQTSPSGTFSLDGLPAGTYSLEARAIGYSPKRVPVNLSSRRPATVTVALDERVQAIQTVVVQGDRTKLQKDYTGFLERSKRGMGRYISEDDIAKRLPIVMTDVLRTTPGIQVVPNGSFGSAVRGRGGQCAPAIYLDGIPVQDGANDLDDLVRPGEAAGVEIYSGSGSVPAQFMSSDQGCGVIVIWTKRGK